MEVLSRHLCMGMVMMLFTLAPLQAKADEELVLHEQEIKAGLLYNFLKYTEWPEAKLAQTPEVMEVCIFGDDPFGGYLRPMNGRSVNQRKINVLSIHSVKDAGKCNLLFINKAEKEQWPALSDFLAGRSILTVSDLKDFSRSGGMIEFSLKNSHIIAELNLETLRSARLYVSARLLKLVSVVDPPSLKDQR